MKLITLHVITIFTLLMVPVHSFELRENCEINATNMNTSKENDDAEVGMTDLGHHKLFQDEVIQNVADPIKPQFLFED
jgi:hypothetical protein